MTRLSLKGYERAHSSTDFAHSKQTAQQEIIRTSIRPPKGIGVGEFTVGDEGDRLTGVSVRGAKPPPPSQKSVSIFRLVVETTNCS